MNQSHLNQSMISQSNVMKKTGKNYSLKFLVLLLTLFSCTEFYAQYGYGNSGYGYGRGGYGYGRQRNAIPQAQEAPKKEEPKTAAEIVDGEMPSIAEALELNEFETAVLSSILKKYVQERIEAQILELPHFILWKF